MTTEEPLTLTLPDTQNADELKLTQSQDVQTQKVANYWGKLCPINFDIETLEMDGAEYSVGRAIKCNRVLNTCCIAKKYLEVMSKVHFKIKRITIKESTKDFYVVLEDFSFNGTYVNGVLVGKGKKIILENNDVIALAKPNLKFFIYMSYIAFEGFDLPPELRCKYAVSRKLGSGACGDVKLVFSKRDCHRYAMKAIVKKSFSSDGNKNPLNDHDRIMNEVKILKALKHPCIIKMEDIVDTPSTVYIVLELMAGGELFDRIKKYNGLPENIAKLIFYQVVLAVHYLHQRGITHRDLKPENILLASQDDITIAKVSDFGLSKLVNAETMMRTFCGTPMYVAPEILITSGRGSYTKQVDVWSLGVILYATLTGTVPFMIQSRSLSLQQQIIKGHYGFPKTKFGHISVYAIDLIRKMMTVDPDKRITINQVLSHEWLRDRAIINTVNSLLQKNGDENNIPHICIDKNLDEEEIENNRTKRPRLR